MDAGQLGKQYGDGEVICRQGDKGDHMFVIQSGHAVVFREDGGVEVEVGELKAGDVFGEMAIFERQARSATVRARGDVRALTLDKRAFLRQTTGTFLGIQPRRAMASAAASSTSSQAA